MTTIDKVAALMVKRARNPFLEFAHPRSVDEQDYRTQGTSIGGALLSALLQLAQNKVLGGTEAQAPASNIAPTKAVPPQLQTPFPTLHEDLNNRIQQIAEFRKRKREFVPLAAIPSHSIADAIYDERYACLLYTSDAADE